MTTSDYKSRSISLLGQYAGFISRLIAFVVDTIIVSGFILFSSWFIGITATIFQAEKLVGYLIRKFPFFESISSVILSPQVATISILLIVALYYIFFWSYVGQTPGKALMGVRIVRLNGKKLTFGVAAIRYLGYYLSAMTLFFGFLWILIDDKRMGWHDKLARTCVIYSWDAKPDENFLKDITQKLVINDYGIQEILDQQPSTKDLVDSSEL